MRERIDRYARRLEGLSIAELSRGAEKLLSRERRHTAALIAHLAEISRRKGHLELGYKSLFDYCVIRLSRERRDGDSRASAKHGSLIQNDGGQETSPYFK